MKHKAPQLEKEAYSGLEKETLTTNSETKQTKLENGAPQLENEAL